jgi:Protein of unknown function (DUF3808)
MVYPCFVIHVYISTHFFFLGVFFLFGAGRLSLCRSQPEQAIKYYNQAMRAQSQYRNLHHISHWEIAVAYLSLWDIKSSLSCWTELEKDATVSEFHCSGFGSLFTLFLVVEVGLFIWNGYLFVGDWK